MDERILRALCSGDADWTPSKPADQVFTEFFATSNPFEANVEAIFEARDASSKLKKAEPVVVSVVGMLAMCLCAAVSWAAFSIVLDA